MANDFRLPPVAGAKAHDFTLNADVVDTATISALPGGLSAPEPEEALARTRAALTADGFDPRTVQRATRLRPEASGAPVRAVTGFDPVRAAFAPSHEESLKIAMDLASEGVQLSPTDLESMTAAFNRISGGGVSGLAETRKWWQRLHRALGDKVASTVADGVMDFSLGLALLDGVQAANKWFKLQFVPKEKRAELQARVLPAITLEDMNGREHRFHTGTSAALWVMGQRLWGMGEQVVAKGIGPRFEAAQALDEQGHARQTQAFGQIPPMVQQLGPNIEWKEVVERNVADDDIDSFYLGLKDLGGRGELAMAGLAAGNALAEVFVDPVLIGGSMIAKIPGLARTAAARIAPGATARVAAQVARRTYRVEDALQAVATAEQKVRTVDQTAREARTAGGGIPMEHARRMVLARQELARERQWLGQFQDAGQHEAVLLRTAKRSKEWVPSLRTTEQYVDLHVARGTTSPNKDAAALKAMDDELADIRQQLAGADPTREPRQHAALRARAAAIDLEKQTLRQTPKGLESPGKPLVATDKEQVERLAKLTAARNRLLKRFNKLQASETNPEYVRLKGKLDKVNTRIASIQAREGLVIEHGAAVAIPKTRVVPRPVHEVADELHLYRHAELERDFDGVLEWNRVDDLPLFQQRQVLGPDDAEQAGDALNHITRTGGVGVDDVGITPQAVEYNVHPESQLPLIDWRKIDAANQATRTERQLRATSGGRQLDLGLSTQRSLLRQEDVLKRALGAARRIGDKPAIEQYGKELAILRKVRANTAKLKPETPFEEKWLPKATKGLMQDPERLNGWLDAAGDRVIRSLYPGGLALNSFWDTKGGQVFAPLREPGRFFETHDPVAWDRLRSSYLRYQNSTRNWYEQILSGAEKAGVMTKRSKFDPRKDLSPYEIDAAKNELLFDLLDNPRNSPRFEELSAKASPEMLKLHDKVRAMLNHAAEKQGITDTDLYLTGYIRHIFDSSQFAGGARPLEFIGLPAKAEVFTSHLLARTGAEGFPRDAMLALDYYGRGMYRKLIIEPMFDDLIRAGGDLAAKHGNPMFQTYANDLVSVLKGKPTLLGKKLDDVIGGALNKDGKPLWQPGTIDRTLVGISGLFWAGSLAGNPRYPLMQIATGTMTTASRFGLWRTARGLFEMGTREGQAINKSAETYDTFLDIFESDFMRRFSKMMATRVGPVPTAWTEEYIRGATALAAVDMYMTKFGFASWREAVNAGWGKRVAFEALRASEEVNHMYGALGRTPMPARVAGPGMMSAGTQFLSFIPKQTEELLAQFNRDPGAIAQYLAMSGWLSRVAAQEVGVDVTNYVGLGYVPEDPSDFSSPAADTFMKGLAVLHDHSARNAVDLSRSMAEFTQALDGMIPGLVLFESVGKSAQRLNTGEQTSALGERQRGLDLTVGPGEANPGVGGDLIPTLFGQQAIRENLFRRGQQAVRRENQRYLHNLQKTVRSFIDAVEDGDEQKFAALEGELVNTYNIRLSSPSAIERAMEAREISWFLRQLEGNAVLQDRMIKIGEDFGLELAP